MRTAKPYHIRKIGDVVIKGNTVRRKSEAFCTGPNGEPGEVDLKGWNLWVRRRDKLRGRRAARMELWEDLA